jgi:hypothetical protein
MKNFAYLKPESPFYDLFENGRCPIINIIVPHQVGLEGSRETEVYMVDLNKIEDQRVWEIARRLAEKAGADPQQVLADMKEHGLPLRVSQTTGCETDVPFFL